MTNSTTTTSKPTIRPTNMTTTTTPQPVIDISNILEDNAHMVLSFNTSGEISSLINFIRLKNKSRPK